LNRIVRGRGGDGFAEGWIAIQGDMEVTKGLGFTSFLQALFWLFTNYSTGTNDMLELDPGDKGNFNTKKNSGENSVVGREITLDAGNHELSFDWGGQSNGPVGGFAVEVFNGGNSSYNPITNTDPTAFSSTSGVLSLTGGVTQFDIATDNSM
jgi:hypothetical protein